MSIEGARRVMETTSADVANQYLRFGWKLINQHTLPATDEAPARVEYVLASIRTLEDTRAVVTLTDPASVNAYLKLGWKLIDKFVTNESEVARRETLHFSLAWQSEFDPEHPGEERAAPTAASEEIEIDEQAFDGLDE